MYLNYNIAEIQQLFNECENGIFTYKRVYGIIVGKYKDQDIFRGKLGLKI